METEEKKFLDLDVVADKIIDAGDRSMFREAMTCYHVGSHRAAIILAWCATAACMKRVISMLAAEGDDKAEEAWVKVEESKEQSKHEETLIGQWDACGLISDYEKKCLIFARDTRSKCAHPTEVVPSAEAVRHILEICSQIVLCRKAFRGESYIRHVTTTLLDDTFFLPDGDGKDLLHDEKQRRERCSQVIDRVPKRLWGKFPAIAAAERAKSGTAVWKRNALAFFQTLLEKATDETILREIATGMNGFQQDAPDFFPMLVGLDQRVTKFWDQTERETAREQLVKLNLTGISQEQVRAWAVLCLDSDLTEKEEDLLRGRLGMLARHLPEAFLAKHRDKLYKLLAEIAEKDNTTSQAAIALRYLFTSRLADVTNADSKRIISQIINRFSSKNPSGNAYKTLLANCESWKVRPLVQLLQQSEAFFAQCNEENASDVVHIFAAAAELARHAPGMIPDEFFHGIVRVLRGELMPEWRDSGSQVGDTFVSQLRHHMRVQPDAYSALTDKTDLIEAFALAIAEPEEDAA